MTNLYYFIFLNNRSDKINNVLRVFSDSNSILFIQSLYKRLNDIVNIIVNLDYYYYYYYLH